MITTIYKELSKRSAPALSFCLSRRIKSGKEDPHRINERYGISNTPRPDGNLVWIHAASVGEAQSAIILLNSINTTLNDKLTILVTTGTKTSAELMAKRLPDNAIHQYAPWDHPKWVTSFLDHWKPNIAFWMESELWPNTLDSLKARKIPSALINARMSPKSFRNWSHVPKSANDVLSCFDRVICQTDEHGSYFKGLAAHNVSVVGNLKYSASPLPYDKSTMDDFKKAVNNRPVWLYASSHAGEERLACDIHKKLKSSLPDLLTIIVPRHPERTDDIVKKCDSYSLNIQRRTKEAIPQLETDIYIADTLGELGLFYALSDIAVIGRSFSNDGGGGHNPIEASLLNCAVVTGVNYQNQQELFDGMKQENACVVVDRQEHLADTILELLEDDKKRDALILNGQKYASNKANVIDKVMKEIEPLFLKANMPYI